MENDDTATTAILLVHPIQVLDQHLGRVQIYCALDMATPELVWVTSVDNDRLFGQVFTRQQSGQCFIVDVLCSMVRIKNPHLFAHKPSDQHVFPLALSST